VVAQPPYAPPAPTFRDALPCRRRAGAACCRRILHPGWTHSIEKIRWEEDWRIEDGALHLVEARIRGSGAGMEPPAGAVLKNGVWHYRPNTRAAGRACAWRIRRMPAGYNCASTDAARPLADLLRGESTIGRSESP
jgi:hypothetical protein